MTPNGIVQILLFFGVVTLCTKPIGLYMARVFEGERTILSPVIRPIEKLFYALFGVRETRTCAGRHTRSPCSCLQRRGRDT